jgi:hypothetical protein
MFFVFFIISEPGLNKAGVRSPLPCGKMALSNCDGRHFLSGPLPGGNAMADILSYLDWRGDLSFKERPFNDVDNLILSELAYLDMTGIVPGPGEEGIMALRDVYPAYVQMGYDQSCMPNDPKYLASAAARSQRFGEIRLWRYVDEIDRERQIQFAAVTCFLPDGSIYVAYRGTDHSLVGWREDFNTSFMNETPGQFLAASYLNDVMAVTQGPVMVGGHSKGGNLAVYAAAFCDVAYRGRISIVYSNDGPGFNEKITETPEYRAVLPKVQLTIPESSVIGIIMDNKHASRIVRCSSSNWVEQHNPYSWQVNYQGFELAEAQSVSSRFLNSALDQWISSLTDEEKVIFVNAVFDSMEASGAATLEDLIEDKRASYNAIVKAARELDPEIQKSVVETLKKLGRAGTDVALGDAKKAFEQFRETYLRPLKGLSRTALPEKHEKDASV